MRTKYPRTFHLPFSPGATSDDKIQHDLSQFYGQRVIITEKMDGENTTIYQNGYHARSLDSAYHPSRSRVAALAATIGGYMDIGDRICGENLTAVHSIKYDDLESFFLGFSYWHCEYCYEWDSTVTMFELLEIKHVPVLYDGIYDEKVIQQIIKTMDFSKSEGFVMRVAHGFTIDEFPISVVKYVRENHVQTDEHWSRGSFEENIFCTK